MNSNSQGLVICCFSHSLNSKGIFLDTLHRLEEIFAQFTNFCVINIYVHVQSSLTVKKNKMYARNEVKRERERKMKIIFSFNRFSLFLKKINYFFSYVLTHCFNITF